MFKVFPDPSKAENERCQYTVPGKLLRVAAPSHREEPVPANTSMCTYSQNKEPCMCRAPTQVIRETYVAHPRGLAGWENKGKAGNTW